MAGPEQRGEPWRLGRLTLLEPLRAEEPDGPWVGREAGRVALLVVDRVSHPDLFHRGRVRTLTHPAIESLLDRRLEDRRWVQIRELVLGASLRDVLAALERRGERVPPAVARAWAEAVLDALEFLEGAEADGTPLRLRHGALSADTVWVTFGGGLRVCDHELLRLRTPDQEPTLPGDDEALTRDVQAAAGLLRGLVLGPGDRPERRDLSPSTVAELERALRPGDVIDSFRAFAAGVRPTLSALAPAASEAEVAEWLGASVPDVERATLARLRRVRSIGARASPTDVSEDDQPTLSSVELGVSEPFEPSVITMPGERVSLGRKAPAHRTADAHEAPTRPGRGRPKARTWAPVGAAVAVAALLAGGWWLGGSVAGRPDAGRAPRVVASPSAGADAASGGTPTEAEMEADAGFGARASEPARRGARTRPIDAGSTTARVATGGPRRVDAAASSAAARPARDLRARLAAAEASPDDPSAFEAALRAARDRLAALGPAAETEAGRSAQASLRRAELSWDLEALRRAIHRVEALGAPP